MLKHSALLELEDDLKREVRKIDSDSITKWLMQFASRYPLKLTHPDGRKIHFEGVAFAGSTVSVYDNYIIAVVDELGRRKSKEVSKRLSEISASELDKFGSQAASLIRSAQRKLLFRAYEIKGRLMTPPGQPSKPMPISGIEMFGVCEYIEAHVAEQKERRNPEMSIAKILNDRVKILNTSGEIVAENVQANCQKEEIVILAGDWPLERGYHVLRERPGALFDDYEIDDPGFSPGLKNIPPHYLATFGKASGKPQTERSIVNILTGQNARINIDSVDKSHNIAAGGDVNFFQNARDTVLSQVPIEDDRDKLVELLSVLESQSGQTSFKETYVEFIAVAANHATVLAPIMVGLASML